MIGLSFDFPFWVVALFFLFLFFFATVPPLFCGLGIYRLIKKTPRRSSFIVTCAIFSLILLSGLIERDEANPFGAIVFFTLPFSFPGLFIGSFFAAGVMGLTFTWFTVFGLVTSVRNRFGKERL